MEKEPRVEAAENQYGAGTRGLKRQETSNLLPFTVYRHPREGGDLEKRFEWGLAHVSDGCNRSTTSSV